MTASNVSLLIPTKGVALALSPISPIRNALLCYSLAHSIGASPVPPFDSPEFDPNSCGVLTRCRTIWNIIWSCLITIFSCIWVAIHLNIPCPKKRGAKNCFQRWIRNPLLSFAEHRPPLFVCALLVPEYILAWAIRQYLRALEPVIMKVS